MVQFPVANTAYPYLWFYQIPDKEKSEGNPDGRKLVIIILKFLTDYYADKICIYE